MTNGGSKVVRQNSYQVILALDEKSSGQNANASGYELFQFAERARTEGSLEVAVAAYEEALKRLKKSTNNDHRREYFISQTELGTLKTKAQLALTKDTAAISKAVNEFETFGSETRHSDLSLEAYQRAGDIAFKTLFDLERAHRWNTPSWVGGPSSGSTGPMGRNSTWYP